MTSDVTVAGRPDVTASSLQTADRGGPAPSSYGPLVAATLWVYVGPCIFVVGLCGNALVLAVMAQRRMRGTSTAVYLQWMAVADLCVLVSGMITEWVEALFDITFKASVDVSSLLVLDLTLMVVVCNVYYRLSSLQCSSLQCFDAFGWAAGRASGL